MVDMANHDGVLPAKTAKGLEPDGTHFTVLAAAPIAKGEQVCLSYGALPNLMLLQQWGFVLDALPAPPDVALVDLSPLLAEGSAARAGLEAAAAAGRLMRERDGAVSAWQPAGPALQAAIVGAL